MHVNGASSTRIPLGGFCACPVADRVHEARVRRGLQDQNSSPGRSDRDTIPPTRTQKGFGPVCALAPKCGLQDGPERTDSDAESCGIHCWGTWTRTKNNGWHRLARDPCRDDA